MRTAAIIIAGLALAMALDGEFKGLPFLLGIALALELRYRSGPAIRAERAAARPSEAQTDRFPAVRKRGRHG